MTVNRYNCAVKRIITMMLVLLMVLGAAVCPLSTRAYADDPDPQTSGSDAAAGADGAGSSGEKYSVTYRYSSGSLPEDVRETLPTDNGRYEDGAKVPAKDPSRTEVTVGDKVYSFDGWDESEKTVNGEDLIFTGAWDMQEDTEDTPDDTEYEDEATIEDNPAQPARYADEGLVTVTGSRQISNAGTHLTSFDHDYGTGLCCYHNRKCAPVGSKGWMRELTAADGHYDDIKRLFYWGMYKNNDKPSLRTAFSIHIMISYWRNGNKSLSSGIKKGTSRFSTAESDCAKLIKKGAAPDNFHIYEWVGTGKAKKKQIVITYKIINGGWVKLKKQAAASNTNFLAEAPNNYSIEGAVYELYTDAACTNRAYDTNYNYVTLTTGANGETAAVNVYAGSYWAKEISASKGFKLDSVRGTTVTTANTAENPAVITSVEAPVYKLLDLDFRKVDISGNHGYKDLLGTEYAISYYDVDMGYGSNAPTAETLQGSQPKRTWKFRTVKKIDSNGHPYAGFDAEKDSPLDGSSPFYTEGGKRVIPRGVVSITETEAAPGMAKNEKVYYCRVYQASNGSDAGLFIDKSLTSSGSGSQLVINVEDDEQHPVIEIRKKDAETGEAKTLGSERKHIAGSLAGAEYAVYYDDPAKNKPEKVGTIITDEKGYGKLEKRTEGDARHVGDWLPLGRYFVEETKASPGYTIDAFYYENKDDEYKNGQHIITARAREVNTGSFTYIIESKEKAHHTYVSKKEITTGKELPGAILQVIDSKGNVVEQWVSSEEPHDIVALHDETQGLKDGKYTLREITAPYGYDVAEDVEFEVSSRKVANTVVMQNKPVTIGTTASDAETGTHQGVIKEDAKVTDKVVITGLYEGRTYKVSGRLIDKNTKEVVKDKNGKDSIAEKEFTATGDEMEIELSFSVDASKFTKETAAVAFEKLERISKVHETELDVVPIEIAKHEDPDDEDQTIHYGGLAETIATDENLISHNILAGPGAVIIDTVKYSNLSTKETYTLEGELYDKTTGQLTGIKASASFRPDTPDGQTEVRFEFDATAYKGHDLVVFETMRIGETTVDEHKDPEDEKQTVHVPEIGTKAGKPKGKKVVDKVSYSNLIPEQAYIVTGWLVDKKTGKKIKGSDGKTGFVPETASGSIDVTLKTKRFKGSAVAFEECYAVAIINGKEVRTKVAEHKDLQDKDQTVRIPGSVKSVPPRTGDDNRLWFYAILMAIACIAGTIFAGREAYRSHKQRKEDKELFA